jgi:hypothetical protein
VISVATEVGTMSKRPRKEQMDVDQGASELSTRGRRPRPTEIAEQAAQNELERTGEIQPGTPTTDTPTVDGMNWQNMFREAQAEISALRSHIVSTQVDHTNRGSLNWAVFNDDRLLPEFDPSNLTQSVDDWLRRVNDCAVMYRWDEVTKMYIALGKLRGIARIWYDGLKSTNFAWAQWEAQLRDMFPSKVTFGKLFYEAATYQANPGQNLTDYCFHKLTKLNKLNLNLSQEQLVDCIVEGIKDPQTKLTIKSARCPTFVALSEYVTNFPCSSGINRQNIEKGFRSTVNESKQKEVVCFTCNEKGHKRNHCTKYRNNRCAFCHKVGHTVGRVNRTKTPREIKLEVMLTL